MLNSNLNSESVISDPSRGDWQGESSADIQLSAGGLLRSESTRWTRDRHWLAIWQTELWWRGVWTLQVCRVSAELVWRDDCRPLAFPKSEACARRVSPLLGLPGTDGREASHTSGLEQRRA